MIKKNLSYLSGKYSPLILFLFAFFFLMAWVPFGIDMTDEGKQMSSSWFMFHGDAHHSYNMMKYGSWFINGAWLSIPGQPFLLWERIGGVLLMSLMALTAYFLIKKYHNSYYTFFIIISCLLFVICRNHPETKIDHSNLPTLIALFSILLFYYYYRSEEDFKGHWIYLLLSLIFMLFSTFTRGPHVLLLFVPLITIFKAAKKPSIHHVTLVKTFLIYYLPLIIGFLGVMIYLIIDNQLSFMLKDNHTLNFLSFFTGLKKLTFNNIFQQYELKKISYFYFLLYRYIRDFIKISLLAIIFLIALPLGEFFYQHFKRSKYYHKITEYIFLSLMGIFLFVFLNIKGWMWYQATFGLFITFFVIIKIKKISLKNESFYLIWGVLLILISFLGSNNSFRHSVPAGAVFILYPLIGIINFKRSDELKAKGLYLFQKFYLVLFIVLLIVGLYKKVFNDNKRDTQPIFTRSVMFKTPELFGIFSNPQRVEVIDSLMKESKARMKKEDRILTFNSVPMFHYLLNVDYFLDDPWILAHSNKWLSWELEKRSDKKQFPDFIIFNKYSAKENEWPMTNVVYEDDEKELYDYLNTYIVKYKYQNVYENKSFILYEKNQNSTEGQ